MRIVERARIIVAPFRGGEVSDVAPRRRHDESRDSIHLRFIRRHEHITGRPALNLPRDDVRSREVERNRDSRPPLKRGADVEWPEYEAIIQLVFDTRSTATSCDVLTALVT